MLNNKTILITGGTPMVSWKNINLKNLSSLAGMNLSSLKCHSVGVKRNIHVSDTFLAMCGIKKGLTGLSIM